MLEIGFHVIARDEVLLEEAVEGVRNCFDALAPEGARLLHMTFDGGDYDFPHPVLLVPELYQENAGGFEHQRLEEAADLRAVLDLVTDARALDHLDRSLPVDLKFERYEGKDEDELRAKGYRVRRLRILHILTDGQVLAAWENQPGSARLFAEKQSAEPIDPAAPVSFPAVLIVPFGLDEDDLAEVQARCDALARAASALLVEASNGPREVPGLVAPSIVR